MKNLNYACIAFLFGTVSAFATSTNTTAISQCVTIPSSTGTDINDECPYNPMVVCCYIAAGNSTQFVTQLQNGTLIVIRRHPASTVTIFGLL